jgi:hypothetical protein
MKNARKQGRRSCQTPNDGARRKATEFVEREAFEVAWVLSEWGSKKREHNIVISIRPTNRRNGKPQSQGRYEV